MVARRALLAIPAALMVFALANPVREASAAEPLIKACTNLAEDG